VAPKPDYLQRATVTLQGRLTILTGFCEIQPTQPKQGTSFKEFLMNTVKETWWYENLILEDNGLDIVKSLVQNTTIAVSDSSFQHSFSMATVIIEGVAKSNHLTNTVIATGGAGDMSAYRAELTGIYTTTPSY
jgi:hypothetical protein